MEIGLVPLRNFGIMEEGKIYRSAQPIYDYEYKWLKKHLSLEKIINLRTEAKIDEQFAPKYGILVENLDVVDHHPPAEEDIRKFIDIIKHTNGPLLFHCEHGNGRTSTFAIIVRLFQGWSLEDALKEESEKFMYNFNHPSQRKFINLLPEIIKKCI